MAADEPPVPFNFGATTESITWLSGSSRPGAKSKRCFEPDLRIPAEEVQEWIAFMKGQGIQEVISLLADDELTTYAEPLQPAVSAAFEKATFINPKQPGYGAQLMAALKAAHASGRKVLVHCWGGGGRTGAAQAAALVVSGAAGSPEEAAEVVLTAAKAARLPRRVDVEAVKQLLAAGAE